MADKLRNTVGKKERTLAAKSGGKSSAPGKKKQRELDYGPEPYEEDEQARQESTGGAPSQAGGTAPAVSTDISPERKQEPEPEKPKGGLGHLWDTIGLGGMNEEERNAAAARTQAAEAYQDEQNALLAASKERERQAAAGETGSTARAGDALPENKDTARQAAWSRNWNDERLAATRAAQEEAAKRGEGLGADEQRDEQKAMREAAQAAAEAPKPEETAKPASGFASFMDDEEDGEDEIPSEQRALLDAASGSGLSADDQRDEQRAMRGAANADPEREALAQAAADARQKADALNAQDKTWWGPMDWDAFDRARAEAAQAQKALTDYDTEAAFVNWEGRDALIAELNEIDNNSGYITDPAQADAAEARRAEIIRELEAGDEAAGNGPQSYNDVDRGRQVVSGATGQYASGFVNAAGTALDWLGTIGAQYGNASPYAGYATDELSAAAIGTGTEEEKQAHLAEMQAVQNTAAQIEQVADSLGENAAADLASAKAGLSGLGAAGVDIATNVIQLGYDAALGKIPGASSLFAMFLRSAGGASQEARQAGASVGEQVAYGLTKGGIEVATEKLFDGVAGIFGKGAADDVVEGAIRRLAETDTGRTVLRVLAGAGGEGAEEAISDLLAPFAEQIYNDESLRNLWENGYDGSEILYDFLIGAAIGGLGSGGSIATGQNAAKNAEARQADAAEANVNAMMDGAMEALENPNAGQVQNEQIDPAQVLAEQATGQQPAEARRTSGEERAEGQTPAEVRQQADEVVDALLGPMADAQAKEEAAERVAEILTTPTEEAAETPQEPSEAPGDIPAPPTTAETNTGESQALNSELLWTAPKDNGGWKSEYNGDIPVFDAVKTAAPELSTALDAEAENGEAYTPLTDALIAAWEDVRQGTVSPMAAATLLSEAYKSGGVEAVKGLYRRATGNLTNAALSAARAIDAEHSAAAPSQQNSEQQPGAALAPTGETAITPTESSEVQQSDEGNGNPPVPPGGGTPSVPSGVQANGPTVERGFAENVRTSETTEEKLAESLGDEKVTYQQLLNRDVLEKAQAIYDSGFDNARRQVETALAAAKEGAKLPPEIVPLARMVANEMSRNGDVTSAQRIIADVAAELTAAGQLGQVGKILRNTDPATVEQTIRQMIDTINRDYAKGHHFGQAANWRAGLTDGELGTIRTTDFTKDGAFEKVWTDIARRIGQEMPATFREKLHEYRRINMLLRPRTQIKNVMSNVPMVVMRRGAETLSGAVQDALVKLGVMDSSDQTRTAAVGRDSRALARDYFNGHRDSILGEGNKFDMNKVLREHRTYFKDGALTKALSKLTGKELHNAMEVARRTTYDLLERGDAPFVRSAFVDNLAQYCAAQGITSAEDITQDAVDFAMANAMEATFKANNAVANLINGLKKTKAGPFVDVIFPFTTTPANITSLMLKYSPLGYVTTVTDALRGADISSTVDNAAKATVGTGVFALGILLRSLGYITGAPDEDKEKAAFDKANGISPYSILGRWSYDWIQPTGSLLALGAEFFDSMNDSDAGLLDSVINAMYSAGDSVLDMSLFQNITSILSASGGNTANIVKGFVEGAATQLVPGILQDVAKITDGTVRSTYTGGNVLDNALAKMQAGIPGLSDNLPASVNVMGEDSTRGSLAWRAFDALLNPGTSNHNQMSETAQELYELYEQTGDKSVFPQFAPTKVGNDKLNGEERAEYQRTMGQSYMDKLDELFGDSLWASADDKTKLKTAKTLRGYAADEAKRDFARGRGQPYSSDYDDEHGLDRAGIELGPYLLEKKAADTNGNGYYTQEELYDWLIHSDYSDAQRAMIWDSNTTGNKTWAAYSTKK